MEADTPHMWHFLRHEVASGYAQTVCVQCRKKGILLETPYRPDLCIDCLFALMEELKSDPITNPLSDKRSRAYDARHSDTAAIVL